MSRKEFSAKTKVAAWARCGGRWEGCGIEIADGDRVDFDHIIPDAFGKDNALSNCQVLCRPCHIEKTKTDVTQIAKAKRVAKKHTGTFRPPRRIVPGSKASPWKKPLHGPAVLRNAPRKEG